MATVFSLPDELMLEVFLYLDVTAIALCVANVCKRWKVLSCDSLLWNSLKFTVKKDMKLSYILNILPQLPQLRHVSLHWRTDSDDIIDVLCDHCPYMVDIKLICCGFLDRGCIHKFHERFNNLRVLSLSKCWSVPSQCLDDIALLTNLTVLNLSNCLLTPQQFVLISHNCAILTSLNIDYVRGISEEMLSKFISQRTKTLESLSVFGELLTDYFFQNIQLCQKLKYLHISTCRMFSDVCFVSICKLKHLKSLTMRKSVNLSSRALWRFYFLSDVVKNLSYLYISAKRNVNNEDVSLWFDNDSDVKRCLIDQYCICILTKDGFNFEKA